MRKIILLVLALTTAALSWIVVSPASSQAAGPPPLTCTGTPSSGGTYSSVIVPAYGYCSLNGITVTGSVKVNPNAAFYSCGSYIGGSLTATSAYVNVDYGTDIGGAVVLDKPGNTQVGGYGQCEENTLAIHPNVASYASLVCSAYIGGGVSVTNAPNNWEEVQIGGCGAYTLPDTLRPNQDSYGSTIRGTVNIQNNRLYVEVDDSTIGGSLICVHNYPDAQAYDVDVTGTIIGTCTRSIETASR